MSTVEKELFMKNMYFWKWMHKGDKECDICGVITKLVAAVINRPPRRGKNNDYISLCERCWSNIKD